MCTRTITALVASFVLALGSLSAGPVRAQVVTAGPVAQDLATNPIGKVVTATGSVKIERANAMVVLANVAGQGGQATVGDLVYLGDVVATGADGRVGINFTDGSSFNLSNNARMALDKFVYDPGGTSNLTLFNVTKGIPYLCCRQDRQDWRYEGRYPRRNHGNSRHHAARGNSG